MISTSSTASGPSLVSALTISLPLPKGQHPRIALRSLGPSDSVDFINLYLKAPPQDRLTRFCGSVSEDFVRRYATRAMTAATELLGLFQDGLLCAAAEIYVDKQDAELAFLVAPEAQHKGLGSILMAGALSAAHQRGASSALVMSTFANAAMRRVALVNGLTHQASDMEWCAAFDIDQECDAHFPSVYQLPQPD